MPTAKTSPRPRGLLARATAKVGPLPVWAWALLLLIAGYLVYRLSGAGQGSSSADGAPAGAAPDPNSTPISGGEDGAPPASGQGGAADNLNDGLLSQLSGFQGSIDTLTAAVQSSPAFWPGAGDSGSGSVVPNTGEMEVAPAPPTVAAKTAAKAPARPAARAKAAKTAAKAPARPAARATASGKMRYYTYTGKAPKTRKRDEAPARGPSGTTLHFVRGKGYYYA